MDRSIVEEESSEHLLLALAITYPVFTGDLSPQGCQYNLREGAWVLKGIGSLLVESPDPPIPKTKKADIETGEDQKSE